MSETEQQVQTEPEDELSIIDCDLHISAKNSEEITKRLPEPFRSKGHYGPSGGYRSPIGVTRDDAVSEDGALGSTPELMRDQVLDPLGIEHAIITGGACLGLVAHPNARYAAALANAYNDWVIETWTEFDDRIHASIGVAPQAPEAAAKEIRRLADHPDMVQVIMGSGTQIPIGQQDYWPIFKAAEEEGLPVAMHIGPKGGVGIGHPNNPGGHSSNYSEAHIAQSINYYGQLASLVFEGVFEEFPDLRFVMIEGEFGWVPDIMWRMDRNWRVLKEEVPWLERPPSEYVREHVRFTTQPIPEPPKKEYLLQLLEMCHAEETVMFCTDYPHWDGDYTPRQVFPRLPEAMERAIFSGNAKDLYDL